jgi:uncharacterized protein YcnI
MSNRRVLGAACALLLASAALAGTAAAHVTIPEPGVQGGFSIVTFSVPNERDDAGTVSLEVQLPQDDPLGSVRPQPKPGWTVETTTRTLDEPIELFGEERTEVIDTVTWSGGTIEPGQFDTFSLSVGQLPDDVDALEFPAIQTYSSGEEVAWIESTPEGGEEPEHPAPVLTLVAGDAEGGHDESGGSDDEGTTTTAGEDDDDEVAVDATPVSDEDDGTDAVAIAALVIAIIAVLLGGAAFLSSRRRTT